MCGCLSRWEKRLRTEEAGVFCVQRGTLFFFMLRLFIGMAEKHIAEAGAFSIYLQQRSHLKSPEVHEGTVPEGTEAAGRAESAARADHRSYKSQHC